jgi:hypothetical protein
MESPRALPPRVVTARLRPVIGGGIIGLLVIMTGFVVTLIAGRTATNLKLAWVGLGASLLLGFAAAYILGHPVVRVGEDGIWIGRPLWRRFIPIADVESVSRLYAGAGQTFDDKEQLVGLELHLGGGRPSIRLPMHGRGAIILEVEQAIAKSIAGARRGAVRAIDVLGRAGRSVDAWKTDLAKLLLQPAGFRDAALSRDDIEGVLSDPYSPAEQRLGAALALRAAGDDHALARIRIAADESAHVGLRGALLRIAADDDASGEVESLLEETEEQRAPAQRR